jgi:hypothetical protein
MSKAALHHNPVDSPGQVDICGEEDNVLALECGDGFMCLHQVGHDLLQGSLPLATGTRAWTRVWPKLTRLLVVRLLCMQERQPATGGLIAAGEHDSGGHLLHGQITDIAKLAATRGATCQLRAARRAHQVASMTLKDQKMSI